MEQQQLQQQQPQQRQGQGQVLIADQYHSIPRLRSRRRGTPVHTGLVSCKSKTVLSGGIRIGISVWEVRENGEVLLRVSSGAGGVPRSALGLALEVARRNGLV